MNTCPGHLISVAGGWGSLYRTMWMFTVSPKVTCEGWFRYCYCLDSRLLVDNHCESDSEGDYVDIYSVTQGYLWRMIKVLLFSGFQVTCEQPLWGWSRGGLCGSVHCHPRLLVKDDLGIAILWIPGYLCTVVVRVIERRAVWKFTVSSKVTCGGWLR